MNCALDRLVKEALLIRNPDGNNCRVNTKLIYLKKKKWKKENNYDIWDRMNGKLDAITQDA